ncbi:choice-of-anchor D domain-containing protein [Myxococcus fulvus]|uniref:choice-of-anchor D domain-containing protein n=1 Tax=Myxococcus fulvus TaxID=33 RepID=UPI003B9AF344
MKWSPWLVLAGLQWLCACGPAAPSALPESPSSSGLVVSPPKGSMIPMKLESSGLGFDPQRVCTRSDARDVLILNDSQTPRRLHFIRATGPFAYTELRDEVGATLALPYSLGSQKTVRVRVAFEPNIPGHTSGSLFIHSDEPSGLPLEVPLSGRGTGPRLEPIASPLSISLDEAGTTGSRTVMLMNSGTEELTSLRTSVNSPFSVQLGQSRVGANEQLPMKVTFAPPATGEPLFEETLVVSSSDPCIPAQRVRLVASRNAHPTLGLNPPSLELASTVGATSAPFPVTVKNQGGARLDVSAVWLESRSSPEAASHFEVTPVSPVSLEPGDEHTLFVRFKPTREGSHEARLRVTSNHQGTAPTVLLTGQAAAALRSLSLSPSSLQFSTRADGSADRQSREVTLHNQGNITLELTLSTRTARAANPFGVSPGVLVIEPGQSRAVVVTFDSTGQPSGPVDGALRLVDATSNTVFEAPLQGLVVKSLLDVTPSALDFTDHDLDLDSARSQSVHLTNHRAVPVTIVASVEPPGPPFSVSGLPVEGLVVPPHETRSLLVTFSPSQPSGFTRTLVIQNTLDATGTSVPLKGTARVSLALDKSALSFGPELPFGTSPPQSVTLTNQGTRSVTLDGISLGGSADFTLVSHVPQPLLLAPGMAQKLDFAFTPQSAGAKSVAPSFQARVGTTQVRGPELSLKGTASGPIADFDLSSLAFSATQLGNTRELMLGINNRPTSTASLRIVDVKSSSAVFTTDFIPASELAIAPGASRRTPLRVTFKPVTHELYAGELSITYEGATSSPRVTRVIPLSGRGAQLLVQFSPPSLDFETLPGGTQEKTVTVTNASEVTIHINDLDILPSTDAGTTFTYAVDRWPETRIEPGADRAIKVIFNPTSSTASETRDLSVSFANAPTRNITIPLTGRVVTPIGDFGPPLTQFTNVPKDERVVQTRTIVNRGSAPLEVSKPYPESETPSGIVNIGEPRTTSGSGPPVVHRWPIRIPVNGTVLYDVTFHPTKAVPSSINEKYFIQSNSNGDNTSTFTFFVQGNVTAPELERLGATSLDFAPPLNTASAPSTIVLLNKGTAPLRIAAITVSSEATPYFCTYYTLPTDCADAVTNLTLQPGEQVDLRVRTQPISDTVTHTGRLIIVSNNAKAEPNASSLEIPLSAKASAGLLVSPLQVHFPPTNVLAESPAQLLRLTNASTVSLTVSGVQFEPPGDFRTGALPSGSLAPLQHVDLPLYFTPRSGPSAGLRRAKGTVFLAGSLPVDFDVMGTATTTRLRVSRPDTGDTPVSQVDFGRVRVATTSTPITLTLENAAQADGGPIVSTTAGELTIMKVELDGPDKDQFTVLSPPGATTLPVKGSMKVTVNFKPTRLTSSAASLVVTSDDSSSSRYSVLLSGRGWSSVLQLSPEELGFGKAVAGAAVAPRKRVTLRNDSIAPITITSVSVVEDASRTSVDTQADHFQVPPFTWKPLAPGESMDVEVTFLPRAGVQSMAELRITSDAPRPSGAGSETLEGSVKLRGEGLTSVFKDLKPVVDFGTLRLSERTSEVLELTNDSSETVTLLRPTPDGERAGDFHVSFPDQADSRSELSIPSGGRIKMKLEFAPQVVARSEARLVLATSTQPEAATMTLRGRGEESFLSVDTTSLDFGWADKGVPGEPRTVTLTNKSDVPAVAHIAKPPGAAFLLETQDWPRQLPPGGSVELSLRFSPQAGGPAEEHLGLRLESADPSPRPFQAEVVIALRGQGRALDSEGGGLSCTAGGDGALWGGGLLLLGLGARRRRPSGIHDETGPRGGITARHGTTSHFTSCIDSLVTIKSLLIGLFSSQRARMGSNRDVAGQPLPQSPGGANTPQERHVLFRIARSGDPLRGTSSRGGGPDLHAGPCAALRLWRGHLPPR